MSKGLKRVKAVVSNTASFHGHRNDNLPFLVRYILEKNYVLFEYPWQQNHKSRYGISQLPAVTNR